MAAETAKKLAHDNSNISSFRDRADKLAVFGEMAGVEIIPYKDASLPLFGLLPVDQQNEIIRQLDVQIDIYESAVSAGEKLSDGLKTLWWATRRLGFVPPSDIFDRINPEDIIEINNGSYQVFRSFSYYKYCSYSLEELYSLTWFDLYEREPGMIESLMACAQEVAKTRKPMWNGPTHIIRERSSIRKHKLKYRMSFMAPLFANDNSGATSFLIGINAEFAQRDTGLQRDQAALEL